MEYLIVFSIYKYPELYQIRGFYCYEFSYNYTSFPIERVNQIQYTFKLTDMKLF